MSSRRLLFQPTIVQFYPAVGAVAGYVTGDPLVGLVTGLGASGIAAVAAYRAKGEQDRINTSFSERLAAVEVDWTEKVEATHPESERRADSESDYEYPPHIEEGMRSQESESEAGAVGASTTMAPVTAAGEPTDELGAKSRGDGIGESPQGAHPVVTAPDSTSGNESAEEGSEADRIEGEAGPTGVDLPTEDDAPPTDDAPPSEEDAPPVEDDAAPKEDSPPPTEDAPVTEGPDEHARPHTSV